jgi:hypothetical protein
MSCGHNVTSGFLSFFVTFAERIATYTIIVSASPSAYDNATTIGPIFTKLRIWDFYSNLLYFPILVKNLQKLTNILRLYLRAFMRLLFVIEKDCVLCEVQTKIQDTSDVLNTSRNTKQAQDTLHFTT